MYRLLSFYGYLPIEDPEAVRDAQYALCDEQGIVGRIYIAAEGINGTCAGTAEAVARYRKETEALLGVGAVDFKEEKVAYIPFADLRVRTRPYLVNLGEGNDVEPKEEGGKRLSPHEWKAYLESGQELTILDVRNDYEAKIGHFEGAKIPPYQYFHQFPQWVEELEIPRDQPVLMYCTGGIRCEKFSGLLTRKGYTDVYQLDGGILRYAEQVGGEHFLGDVFVFDDRMSVDIGGGPTPGRCAHCGDPTARMINCANVDCHTLHLSCDTCVRETRACCSSSCLGAPRVREFREEHLKHPWRRLHMEATRERTSVSQGTTPDALSNEYQEDVVFEEHEEL